MAAGTTVKEKKPKAAAAPSSKAKKPSSTKAASHPPYLEMIKEALLALNERGGSSPYAIAKYMEEKHRGVLPDNFRKTLALQLKNSAAKGKLTKIKASYKLSDAGKANKTPALKIAPAAAGTKKAAAAAGVGKKRKAAAAVEVVKKKKATPKKGKKKAVTPSKAKQPKSIKSPSAKRAKKAAAV